MEKGGAVAASWRVLYWIACALLVSCAKKEISEAPARGTTVLAPVTRSSTVSARASLPFSELAAQVNGQAPTHFSKNGRERACTRIGPKGDTPFGSYDLTTEVCEDIDYTINVERDGPITIGRGPTPNTIRLTMPVRFDGHAGFVGFVAELTKLHRKNFDGAITARADLSMDVDQGWCPKIDITTDFDWRDKARIEIIGGVWIPIADQVSGGLRDALGNLADSLKSSIDCERVQKEVSKVWASYSFPVSLPAAGPAYINVDPEGLGFSGFEVAEDQMSLLVQARAKIDVATSPLVAEPRPLPPLERVPLASGQINLSVPLRSSYEPLVAGVSTAIKGKEFSAKSPRGTVSVRINGVTIYPSREKLVVGMNFVADLPRSLFDVSGDVFLSARPVVVPGGQVIALEDVQFARILDNDLWNNLSVVFESRIKEEITRAAVLDLTGLTEQAKVVIASGLTKVQNQSGLKIQLGDQRIGIRRIVPAENELFVEANYMATATAVLGSKP
jgi:hypothetical protein